jgi:hypothetical protein
MVGAVESTLSRPEFKLPLAAFAFDREGALLESSKVQGGKLTLGLSGRETARAQLFLLPVTGELDQKSLTPRRLEKLGAFQAVLSAGPDGEMPSMIEIPGPVLDFWPFCLCLVRGRVVRSSDGRPVCSARVHVCEVDRLPYLIARLPDRDIFRLRDDLLDALRHPTPPFPPEPIPDAPGPVPGRVGPGPGPGPDPAPFTRPLIRLGANLGVRQAAAAAPAPRLGMSAPALSLEVSAKFTSSSSTLVRSALAENWKLILPYLCLWPWWWRLHCDEVAVVTTDANGRFQAIVTYPCSGDHPDLYFWVEYDFGGGHETVYKPPIACWTRWNYPCGTEVTLHVSDARVPSCHGVGSPPGKEVWVISVGRTVSVGEVYTNLAGSLEGMVREPFGSGEEDYAFGGKLEPRVWFGRADLIAAGITHYLWSVRPQGGSDSDWSPLNRQVIRHYTTGVGTAPVDVMGPEPGGVNAGRFRIRPVDPPSGGIEWLVADEREDLASAHFETQTPAAPDPFPVCGVEDLSAGKYELKLELFTATGAKVVWDDQGIVLRIATGEAPFGTNPVNTQVAGNYHRIKNAGGKTIAFRMVLHVDNSRCGASIDAVAGAGIAVDPDCGVVTLVGSSPTLDVGFHGGRPGGLARFDFDTERGLSTDIPQASAAGGAADASANGFTRTPPCPPREQESGTPGQGQGQGQGQGRGRG